MAHVQYSFADSNNLIIFSKGKSVVKFVVKIFKALNISKNVKNFDQKKSHTNL